MFEGEKGHPHAPPMLSQKPGHQQACFQPANN